MSIWRIQENPARPPPPSPAQPPPLLFIPLPPYHQSSQSHHAFAFALGRDSFFRDEPTNPAPGPEGVEAGRWGSGTLWENEQLRRRLEEGVRRGQEKREGRLALLLATAGPPRGIDSLMRDSGWRRPEPSAEGDTLSRLGELPSDKPSFSDCVTFALATYRLNNSNHIPATSSVFESLSQWWSAAPTYLILEYPTPQRESFLSAIHELVGILISLREQNLLTLDLLESALVGLMECRELVRDWGLKEADVPLDVARFRLEGCFDEDNPGAFQGMRIRRWMNL